MVLILFEARKWYESLKIDKILKALKRNGFEVFYFPVKEDAVSKVLDIIPSDALVGLGGSVTLREIGLPKSLRDRGNRLADHWEARQRGASAEEILKIRRLQLNSDVFITSTNAITETGKLVNTDGTGQRVAAMIFGPKRVIVIAGINKIVSNLDEGLERVNNIAAPMNAKRLNRNPPCTITGVCNDCDSKERGCNVTSIIHRKPANTNITVILVGNNLGY